MSDQISDPVLSEKVAKSTEAVEKLINSLPVEHILKVKEDVRKIYEQQMRVIDKILAQKGYVGGGT